MKNIVLLGITHKVKALQGKLHSCDGAWRCCHCLKGLVLCFANDLKAKQNDHSAQLRLALHHHSHTLYPVQLRILGL